MEQLDVIKRLIKKFSKDMELVNNVNGKGNSFQNLWEHHIIDFI